MRSSRFCGRCAAAAAIVLVSAAFAHADLLVGDYREATNGSVLRYGDAADGAAAPLGAFYTNLAGNVLLTADGLSYVPAERLVYAADFYGQAIAVYAPGAVGNTAPLRKLSPPQLGQPRQVAVDTAHDEMIVVNSSSVIAAYPRRASGSQTAPLRSVQPGYVGGSITRLTNPGAIMLRAASDEIAVPDYNVDAGNGLIGVVLFFARTANGNAAPSRTIEGPQTLLGSDAIAIAYDEAHDEIYVACADPEQYPYDERINVYAGDASGDAAPLRSIAGDETLLAGIRALAWDAAAQTLYVSKGGDNGVPAAVLAFSAGDDGNVAPSRVLTPHADSFAAPHGIAVVPHDLLFWSGFE